jgi:hypothetical protein
MVGLEQLVVQKVVAEVVELEALFCSSVSMELLELTLLLLLVLLVEPQEMVATVELALGVSSTLTTKTLFQEPQTQLFLLDKMQL